MEPLFPLIVLFGVGVAVAAGIAGTSSWKEVAAQLGLEYRSFLQRTLSGTVDGFHVSIRQQKHHIDIKVSGPSIRESLKLSKEGFLSGVLGGRDIEIGCPSFDANTYISSYSRNSEAEVAALLDSTTRKLVSQHVVGEGAKVSGGEITHSKTNAIKEVPRLVKGFVLLARRLDIQPSEIPARLSANALKDPLSSVRLRNLTLLQERFRSSEVAASTSTALLDDSHPSIRLAAAMFLGSEGLRVVREIAETRRALIDVRIKALQHLERAARPEDLIEIASTLLTENDLRLKRMGISSLGGLKHRPSLQSIIALLGTEDDATTLVIIKAIENIGDSSAEAALIGLLDHPNNRVKIAAIEALAKVGTITAVEPLHGLTRRLGLKRSARVAIDSIQSRLGDVESGRLSLAPAIDSDGGLSLAGDPEKAGGLSLDEQDD